MKKFFLLITLSFIMILSFHANAQNIVYPNPGGGATPYRYPFDGEYGFTYNASIYNKANIGVGGSITDIGYYVVSTCPDSVMVTITYEQRNTAEFGGNSTFGALTTNGFQVFQEKVLFNAMGYYFFHLDFPINYDTTKNLGIYIACGWQGTGPSNPPTFANVPVNSGTDFVNMSWGQDNSYPFSQIGQLTNYLPYVALKYDAPMEPVLVPLIKNCDEIDLTSVAMMTNDQVLIATNFDGTFYDPQCGRSYVAGDTLADGSTIVYSGPDGNIDQIGTIPGQLYQYKIWAYDDEQVYSETGYDCEIASTMNIPYATNFNGGSGPGVGIFTTMENLSGHGSIDQGLTAEMISVGMNEYFYTPYLCNTTNQSKLLVSYRILDISGYPGSPTSGAEIDSIKIGIQEGLGSFVWLYSINQGNHVPSLDFDTLEIPIGSYTNEPVRIQIRAIGGTGDYYIDFDFVQITDPTGIENSEASPINLFPNPANDFVTINIDDQAVNSIQILNLAGQEVMSITEIDSDQILIDIRELIPGMYIIETTGKYISRGRFIKQ